MRANELIRKSRERLGLVQADVAQQSGLSVYAYSDIEQHPDEIFTNVSLAKVRCICALLNIDLSDLLAEIGGNVRTPLVDLPADEEIPRTLIIRRYREKRNASLSDVANVIGFQAEAVSRAESDENFLEGLPICVLNDWAAYLGLPLDRMLRKGL